MYISNMELENFRCFPGTTSINFCKKINYFVGNNNCGKTTILKAIDFLLSGGKREDWVNKNYKDKPMSVKITLKDSNISKYLNTEKLKKYKKYIKDNTEIVLRRRSEEKELESKNATNKLTIKNIGIFNPKSKDFENPTGVDKMINALFDAQFVYSDLDNSEYQDFHKTKIVGKLIYSYIKEFQKNDKWKSLENAHKEVFESNDNDSLNKKLRPLEEKLEKIMSDQYGTTKVSFHFEVPSIDYFFNAGEILLKENGTETAASEKGTGMQRALALSLIQAFAQRTHGKDEKPIIFFIDEPETFLHPKAQDKLMSAFDKLSEQSQIFITTHSPYLLKHFNKEKDQLVILSRKNNVLQIKTSVNLNLFPNSPTWGEINFVAFDVVSEEFHTELFEYLHYEAGEKNMTYNEGKFTVGNDLASFDAWLAEQEGCVITDEKHEHSYKKHKDLTMTCYIRNWIDHPGKQTDLSNDKNKLSKSRKKPTEKEIKESIQFMIKTIKKLESIKSPDN